MMYLIFILKKLLYAKFLINLLSYTFTDILITLFGFMLLIILWNTYYIFINSITVPQTTSEDRNVKKLIKMIGSMKPIIYLSILLWGLIFNFLYIQNINTILAFWDAIYLANNTFIFLFISVVILCILLGVMISIHRQNISFSVEYILLIILILLSSFFLIGSTNLFLAIFFLEFIALLIFGKFTVSRTLYNKNKLDTNSQPYITQYSYGLFNSLFFQFWANFVSSVFLFFSLINIHYLFGISNFYMINFFFSLLNITFYTPSSTTLFIIVILITGFFIKLGLSPYQFFKIETYKGIPIFMVVVYTTLYLIIYIYFFLYLLFYQLPMLRDVANIYIIFMITLSTLYLVSLLFDTKNFKAFLSYSTLITVVNLFMVILIV